MNAGINNAINQGIDFLTKTQEKEGSLLSYSTPEPESFKNARTYRSTFSSSLILSCLCSVDESRETKSVKDRLASFLVSQKSDYWSFNYWARDTDESRTLSYPDDLDDTFCALSALVQYNPDLIDSTAMAKIVTLLTAVEEEEGGPYRTWLVPQTAEKIWKDVDLAVNSNVAYFLSRQDVSLPKLSSFIESAIEAGKYESPYYPSAYPVIYFISRFYRGNKVEEVKDFLLSKRNKSNNWDNPLHTALAISALLNLDCPPKELGESISYLVAEQQLGAWSPYIFCIDPAIEGETYYAGSPALTTAFCLEALAKYLKLSENKADTGVKQVFDNKQATDITYAEEIYSEVTERVGQRLTILEEDLEKQARSFIDGILEKDRDRQVVLVPFFYKVSLGQKGKNVPKELLVQLCLANLYGWTAYTIYDDFLDDEGDAKLLPVANMALRELTTIFHSVLPDKPAFPPFFHQLMDKLDSANEWEVACTRIDGKLESIPDYGDYSLIARRSLGHALGPAAILFYLGYNASSVELETLMSFFNYFLIARQLNDDAHDWEQDIKKGHINSVSASILKKWMSNNSSSQLSIGDIQSDILNLQRIFWYDVVVEICNTVLKHVRLARESLQAHSLLDNTSMFERLLIPIENSARKALKEQEDAIEFLQAYEGNASAPFQKPV